MTKNEIMVMPDPNQAFINENQYRLIETFLNGETHPAYRGGDVIADYRYLHEAWVKFRDLKFADVDQLKEFKLLKDQISYAIAYWSITEAFDELVKAIEWCNSLYK